MMPRQLMCDLMTVLEMGTRRLETLMPSFSPSPEVAVKAGFPSSRQTVIFRIHFPCMIVICRLQLAMIEVRKTQAFTDWLKSLKDVRARARILVRIDRLSEGLLGDAKFFDGIGELRITEGPGYRVYFVQRGKEIIILLSGGDKSTQAKDIKRAKEMAKEV
ncbi:type II toxin-antitoxin system RelE/ParE family toxin [Rhizobium paknamense]